MRGRDKSKKETIDEWLSRLSNAKKMTTHDDFSLRVISLHHSVPPPHIIRRCSAKCP